MRDSYFGFAVRAHNVRYHQCCYCTVYELEMWSRDLCTIHRVELRSGIAMLESVLLTVSSE